MQVYHLVPVSVLLMQMVNCSPPHMITNYNMQCGPDNLLAIEHIQSSSISRWFFVNNATSGNACPFVPIYTKLLSSAVVSPEFRCNPNVALSFCCGVNRLLTEAAADDTTLPLSWSRHVFTCVNRIDTQIGYSNNSSNNFPFCSTYVIYRWIIVIIHWK